MYYNSWGTKWYKKLASGTQHQQLHSQFGQKQLSTLITTNQDSSVNKLMDGELIQIIMLYSMSIPADCLTVELNSKLLFLMMKYKRNIIYSYNGHRKSDTVVNKILASTSVKEIINMLNLNMLEG